MKDFFINKIKEFYNLLLSYILVFNQEEDEVDTYLSLINNIDKSICQRIYTNKLNLKMLQSIYPNIFVYMTNIINLTKELKNKEDLVYKKYTLSPEEIYLHTFFSNENKIADEDDIELFIQLTKEFFVLFKELKNEVTDTEGNRKIIVLHHVVNNLFIIINSLVIYSDE